MAIFFGDGYVLEDNPKRAVVCVGALFVSVVEVTAMWPRNAGPC